MTSEFNITFSGAGGHSHDGIGSSRVNTTSYSIFDFRTGVIGNDQSRISLQEANKISFDNYIINLLNTREFSPTLIKIKPSSLTGKVIVQGTISSDKIETNFVLVNQQIKSNNFNGIIDATNVITDNGTTGWAISSSGQSVFNNVTTRGSLISDNGTRGTVITDGYIQGLYSGGVEFRASSGTSYSYINGGTIRADLINVNDTLGNTSSETWINVDGIRVDLSTASSDHAPALDLRRNGIASHAFIEFRGYTTGSLLGSITYNGSNIAYNTSSDERLKVEINKQIDSLFILDQIEIKNFVWKNDEEEKEQIGVFAQQLHSVIPDCVSVGDDSEPEESEIDQSVIVKSPWLVNYQGLIPYLIKAIQELNSKNKDLEARLKAIEEV